MRVCSSKTPQSLLSYNLGKVGFKIESGYSGMWNCLSYMNINKNEIISGYAEVR